MKFISRETYQCLAGYFYNESGEISCFGRDTAYNDVQ